MCINRRGVCPECASSNLYWDICDDTSSMEHRHELARGLQRGGARPCRDHSGFNCTAGLMINGDNHHINTTATASMSVFSTSSDDVMASMSANTYAHAHAHSDMGATRGSSVSSPSLASTPRTLNMGMPMGHMGMGMGMDTDMGVETAMAGVRLETPVVSWAVVSW